jgi:hypothetical protein
MGLRQTPEQIVGVQTGQQQRALKQFGLTE